jgi:hypothetical protein
MGNFCQARRVYQCGADNLDKQHACLFYESAAENGGPCKNRVPGNDGARCKSPKAQNARDEDSIDLC